MSEKLQIVIDVKDGKAVTTLKSVEKGVDGVGRQSKSSSKAVEGLSSSFAKVAGTAAIAASAVSALSKLTKVSRAFDVINASLITVTGSVEAADVAFGRISQFAATTPFQLTEVANAFVKMKALGLDPSQAALTSYGNTASAMGKSLNQMIEAVADAATGEFERLKEFGIKSSSQGDKVSFTFRGVTTTVGKNAREIEGFLKGIGNTDFAGAMERRSDSLDGALSNLADSWDGLFRTISKSGMGSLLKDIATEASNAAQGLGLLIEVASGAKSKLALNAQLGDLRDNLADVKKEYNNLIGGGIIDKGLALLGHGMLGGTEGRAAALIADMTAIEAKIKATEDKLASLKGKEAAASSDETVTPKGASTTTSVTQTKVDAQKRAFQTMLDQQKKYHEDTALQADLAFADEIDQENIRDADRVAKAEESFTALIENKLLQKDQKLELERQHKEDLDNLEILHQQNIIDIQAQADQKRIEGTRRAGAKEVKLQADVSSRIASIKKQEVATIFAIANTLAPMITKNAKAQMAIQAALAMGETFVNYQVAVARTFAELGPIAGAPVAAAQETAMGLSMGLIAAKAALQLSGSGGAQRTAPSFSGSSFSSTTPVGGTITPATPVSQQPVNNIYMNGTFVDMQTFLNDGVVPGIQDQLNNGSVVLFDNQSAQAQVLAG